MVYGLWLGVCLVYSLWFVVCRFIVSYAWGLATLNLKP